MDFFDSKRDQFSAMGALANTDLQNVSLNYQMLRQYNQELLQREIMKNMSLNSKQGKVSYQAPSNAGPIRPHSMRYFSTG